MDWADLYDAAAALRAARALTATEAARAGAWLLQRSLAEMYVGEPHVLRSIVLTLTAARPEVVSLRNVGVAVLATAQEAHVGDRMAAAERSARRLAHLLEAVPAALGRRARPLLQGTVLTVGCSSGVRAAFLQTRDRVQRIVVFDEPSPKESGRLAAELAAQGLTVERAASSEQAGVLKEGTVALLGCYALLGNGSAVTDSSAAALARDAWARGVPVYVMADTLKLAPWMPDGASRRIALEPVPPERIAKVITEEGIRQPHQLQSEAADLADRWRRLDEAVEGELLV